MKDPHYVEKVEKAIAEKYGESAVQNPKANWTRTKELDYLKQIKKIAKKKQREVVSNKIEVNGVFLPMKLFTKETKRTCSLCNVYSFNVGDDLYMTKFDCCYNCWIECIQGREER